MVRLSTRNQASIRLGGRWVRLTSVKLRLPHTSLQLEWRQAEVEHNSTFQIWIAKPIDKKSCPEIPYKK